MEIHYGKFIDFLPLVQKVLKLMYRQELWGNKMSQRHSNDICISGSPKGFRFERKIIRVACGEEFLQIHPVPLMWGYHPSQHKIEQITNSLIH